MSLLDASHARPKQGGASFSLGHRVHRACWTVIWLLLAAWTPPPLHRWRVFLLRLFGADVHYSAHVYASARIWYPPNLQMAAHSCLGPRVTCYCMAPIRLGPDALVSQGAYLCGGTHDIEDPHFQLVVRPITIGAGAWVAAEAFIGPSVDIGEEAVIGARAVLFSDASPGGVYTGNPAKCIKMRKSDRLGGSS